MAVNLIDSTDIKIIQEDNDITLETDKTTLNTIIQSKINEYTTYSTTETRIGTWIDGKPLYRKVIQTNTPADTSVAHVAELTNVNTVIDIKGMLFYSNQQVPLTLAYSTTVLNAIMTEGNYINVKVSASAYTNCPCNIIVEYTKTTD